ncbi:MAG: rhomboid family intramembrane serine protease [Waddliaceae bacterium]
MGTYDRDYAQNKSRFGSQIHFGVAPVTPVVLRILIANVVIFLLSMLIPSLGRLIVGWFAVIPISISLCLQLWRLVTYQFLHAGFGHIFYNMLVLFFFGPILERLWGSKRFLIFYLSCGATGGFLYTVMILADFPWVSVGMLVGASGAIYGTLAAIAILFPRMKVYLFGIFPLQMMVLVIILIGVSLLNVQARTNVGGEMAHLSGMITGAVWVLWPSYFAGIKAKWQAKKRSNKIKEQYNFETEVDRILGKVHKSGINSLSEKEKKILHQASERKK